MRRFEKVIPDTGTGDLSLVGRGSCQATMPNLTLPYESRRKSRQLARLDNGEEIGLLLPPGTILKNGDILESADGDRIRIVAAAEPVLLVTSSDNETLTRAAYHLGNRHTPVEVGAGFLRLETDPVLQEMLLRLGVTVEEKMEAFQPESGAYGGGHRHGHDESDPHGPAD
jgi:urease accessory protein